MVDWADVFFILEADPMSINRGCLAQIVSYSQSYDGRWLSIVLQSDRSLISNAMSIYEWEDRKGTYIPRVRISDHEPTHVRVGRTPACLLPDVFTACRIPSFSAPMCESRVL